MSHPPFAKGPPEMDGNGAPYVPPLVARMLAAVPPGKRAINDAKAAEFLAEMEARRRAAEEQNAADDDGEPGEG